MATKDKKDELIRTVKERLQLAIDWESINRKTAIEDQRFENGYQWTEKEIQERSGRPTLTINKTQAAVKQIINDYKLNRHSIKVRPVDSQGDKAVADLFTGIIRNIENVSNAEDAYDLALQHSVTSGWGYIRVLTEYAGDTFDQDIRIERVTNQYSVYMDPHARKIDRSDAKWAIITHDMPRDDFIEMHPKASLSDIENGQGDHKQWINQKEVKVAEYFTVEKKKKMLVFVSPPDDMDTEEAVYSLPPEIAERLGEYAGKTMTVGSDKGDMPEDMYEIAKEVNFINKEREVETSQVMWQKVSGAEILEGPKKWAGKYIPIVPVLGEEIWIEGECILRSAIRFAKDPARLYNWGRSNAVETLALAPRQPWMLTKEQIKGFEADWDNAYRQAKPYLLVNEIPAPHQRLSPSMPDTGALSESMQAADDIKATTGIYDASLGARGNETSGRAIRERKNQGYTANLTYSDNLGKAIKHLARILVDLIPKIFDTQRVVRLLNEDGSTGWATVNAIDPTTKKVSNDLSIGRYDVVVSAGPAYSTRRVEAAEGMVNLLTAAPQYANIIIPRIAKNQDWPDSEKLAEEMEKMNQMPPEVQQMQQAIQQLQKQLEEAKDKKSMELMKLAAQGELKREELDLKERLEQEKIDIDRQQLELKELDIRLSNRPDNRQGGE